MKAFLFFLAIAGASCQTEYFIITDEVTNQCDCLKFGVAIAYKNGGTISSIIGNQNNSFSADDDIGCVVAYTDQQGTFGSSSDFQDENETCLQIGTDNVLSDVYSYADTAANLIDNYSNIDFPAYKELVSQTCNTSVSQSPLAVSPATPALAPDARSQSAPTSALQPSSTLAPSQSALAPAMSAPTPALQSSPTPAPSSTTSNAKRTLSWLLTFFVTLLLLAGSSYGDIVVIQPVSACPDVSPNTGGGGDSVTQADSQTVSNALASDALGGI